MTRTSRGSAHPCAFCAHPVNTERQDYIIVDGGRAVAHRACRAVLHQQSSI